MIEKLKAQLPLQLCLQNVAIMVNEFQSHASSMEPYSEESLARFLAEINALFITANTEMKTLSKD